MVKTKRSIFKRIFTGFMVIMFFCSIFMINTQAKGNVSDKEFEFNFSDYTPYRGWLTENRLKMDDTSSYMKCNSISKSGYSYTAWVMAAKLDDHPEFGIDVGSKKYVFYAGSERWMVNYVKEKGYSYARIEGWPNYNGIYRVSGVWSPDSV